MKKSNKHIINSILVAMAFSLNTFIFAPLEIYLTNKEEFWFRTKDFLAVILICGGISFVCISLMLVKGKKGIALKTISSLTLAMYIQGNFLNFGYNVLDGTEIKWNTMVIKGIINTFIWMLIIILPWHIKKLKKIENLKVYTSYLSIFIILIETITLGTLIFTQNRNEEKKMALTNENIFNLSNEKNIIVFMADTFEGTYMNEILEKYPEYKEKLSDFTYFDNCTGVSFFTYSSMPTLLTGIKCEVGKNLNENVEYAFENTNLYSILKENNYSTEIYTENALTPTYVGIDNLKQVNETVNFNNKAQITKKMYKFVLYRYLPHFLKRNFTINSDEFIKLKTQSTDKPYTEKTYLLDDVAYNEELIDSGITTIQNKNSFKFYQLNGMHYPYNTTENIKYSDSQEYEKKPEIDRKKTEGIATINLLCNYINELKEAGIYENTEIIFLADHGYENRFYTTLLVKEANASHDFEISSSPVTLVEDLIPTILNAATDSKNYGRDFFDYKEGEVRIRKVYDYTYITDIFNGNVYKVISKITFQSDQEAEDADSFKIVNEEYENDSKELSGYYKLGEIVTIDKISETNCINLTGFSLEDIDIFIQAGWNISKNAYLTIRNPKVEKNVVANFKFGKLYNLFQTVNVRINGETICTKQLNKFSDHEVSFTIPKEIWNSSNELMIELEFPDAKFNQQAPTMMLAVCLDSFSFEEE